MIESKDEQLKQEIAGTEMDDKQAKAGATACHASDINVATDLSGNQLSDDVLNEGFELKNMTPIERNAFSVA